METEDKEAICPVCGKANNSQMAKMRGRLKCWCFDVSVDKAKLE